MKFKSDYLFYYKPDFYFIFQYYKSKKIINSGIDYYRYFKFQFNLFSASKTKVPALCIELIVFGIGFYFITHRKK